MLQIQYIESGGGDHLCSEGGDGGASLPVQCGGLDGWQRETLIGFDTSGAFTCIPALQQLPCEGCQRAHLDQPAKRFNYKRLLP